MSAVIFYQLLVCALINAFQLFLLESSDLFSFDIIAALHMICMHSIMAYIYCYLAESVTENLHSIGVIFYEFGWYLLPVNEQKLFVLPIQRAHREFYFSGFGLIDCTLKNFLSVNIFLASIP